MIQYSLISEIDLDYLFSRESNIVSTTTTSAMDTATTATVVDTREDATADLNVVTPDLKDVTPDLNDDVDIDDLDIADLMAPDYDLRNVSENDDDEDDETIMSRNQRGSAGHSRVARSLKSARRPPWKYWKGKLVFNSTAPD